MESKLVSQWSGVLHQVSDVDTGMHDWTTEGRGQGMAMMTLEKAALKLTTELMLPPYAVTPSTLCEWSRKTQGRLLDIQFLHGEQVRDASGMVVDMPGESYFTVPCDFLFDLEMNVDVSIVHFFKRGEVFHADAPVIVKPGTLRVDRQQITELISFIQKIGTNQTPFNQPETMPADVTVIVEEMIAPAAIAAVKLEIVRTAPDQSGSAKSKSVKQPLRKAPVKLPVKLIRVTAETDLWHLNTPSETDVLTNFVFSVLNEKFHSGAPCPSAREVMTLCKKKNKYGVLYIKNELKYLNDAGQLETASMKDVSEKISELTTMSNFLMPANRIERMSTASV